MINSEQHVTVKNNKYKHMKHILAIAIALLITSCASQKTYKIGEIKTPKGDILVWLSDKTPNHKKSFIELANKGYWDSYTFNRVIPGFVAQGGCPDTPEGFNDPEYLLKPEFHKELKHSYGALGAGRDGNKEKLSARCQFYIVQNKDGLARLDGDYTIFGNVIKGMDIVDAITAVKRDSTNAPLTPISLDINIITMDAKALKAIGFTPASSKE